MTKDLEIRLLKRDVSEIREYARKSLLKLKVAVGALERILGSRHKSGRAKRLAAEALACIEAMA